MTFLKRFYVRLVRPKLVRIYSFATYRTFDAAFGDAVRDWKPDVIHAHDGVTLPAAAHAAQDLGARLVFDSHELETHRNPPPSRLRRWQIRRMERKYLAQANRVITVSERIADHLAAEYGIARPAVLFNAPPAAIENVPERWEAKGGTDVRQDAGVPPGEFLFVYTGNVTLNRGLELVIAALGKLQGHRDPNGRFGGRYHLATVGNAQSGHDRAMRELASKHGVTDVLHMLPPVAPQRVWSYISTADASVIPIQPVTLSYQYAMPNKLFEAMLAGNPILASDLAELGAFVREHRLGLTFDPESPEECLAKMIEMVGSYPKFVRSEARQKELAGQFAWEAQEKKLLALYDEMLTQPVSQV